MVTHTLCHPSTACHMTHLHPVQVAIFVAGPPDLPFAENCTMPFPITPILPSHFPCFVQAAFYTTSCIVIQHGWSTYIVP